jgi:hypothetical protein
MRMSVRESRHSGVLKLRFFSYGILRIIHYLTYMQLLLHSPKYALLHSPLNFGSTSVGYLALSTVCPIAPPLLRGCPLWANF